MQFQSQVRGGGEGGGLVDGMRSAAERLMACCAQMIASSSSLSSGVLPAQKLRAFVHLNKTSLKRAGADDGRAVTWHFQWAVASRDLLRSFLGKYNDFDAPGARRKRLGNKSKTSVGDDASCSGSSSSASGECSLYGTVQRRVSLVLSSTSASNAALYAREDAALLENHFMLRAGESFALKKLCFQRFMPPESAKSEFSWWTSAFGKDAYGILWGVFAAKLAERKGISSNEISRGLRLCLDTRNEGLVTASAWASYCSDAAIGGGEPSVRASAPSNLYLSKPWFGGFLSRDQMNGYLERCRPGDFLIRFSTSRPCCFVVGYLCEDGSIYQDLIRRTAQGYCVCGGDETDTFDTLTHFIDANSDVLRRAAPLTGRVANTRGFFKGYISYEETVEMLEGKRAGTFLARFSSSKRGWIVFAHVAHDKKCLQYHVETCPERGYVLGDGVYASLGDIVARNESVFRFPVDYSPDEDASSGVVVSIADVNAIRIKSDDAPNALASDVYDAIPH